MYRIPSISQSPANGTNGINFPAMGLALNVKQSVTLAAQPEKNPPRSTTLLTSGSFPSPWSAIKNGNLSNGFSITSASFPP